MNKEQKHFKKTMKQRAVRKKFEKRQIRAKLMKEEIVKKEKIAYKFDKLQKKIEREKYIKANPPVSLAPTTFPRQKVI